MDAKNLEQFFTGFSSKIPSRLNFEQDFSKFLDPLVAEQLRIETAVKEQSKKSIKKEEEGSDSSEEETRLELKKVLKEYRKNNVKKKKSQKADSSIKIVKEKNNETDLGKSLRKSKDTTNCINGETNTNVEAGGNGDASSDIKELINYFLFPSKVPTNSRKVKSYSDYEKQGAIPKGKTQPVSTLNEEICPEPEKAKKKNKKAKNEQKQEFVSSDGKKTEPSTLNSHSHETETISEEISSKPFFYIVPKNPSPNFFFPRGSYYIVPKIPDFETKEEVIFHPEVTAKKKKEKPRSVLISEVQSNPEQNSDQLNNLGKDFPIRRNSHLNICPLSVAQNEFSNNLEKPYKELKYYQKHLAFVNGIEHDDEREKSFKLVVEQDKNFEVGEAEVLRRRSDKTTRRLDETVQVLMSEFSDLSAEVALSVAQKYLNNAKGLEDFIASERFTRKLQNQFERLVLALPENSFAELREKCDEFAGNEELLENYIEEQKIANEMRQVVLELQHIFPDADPDFLSRKVKQLNGDANGVSILTTELLESNNYPKIPEGHNDVERRRLWKTYVTEFKVKDFIRKAPNLESFEENITSNKSDEDLARKFLEYKYPSLSPVEIQRYLERFNYNIVKICNELSGIESVALAESSFQNEKFSEDFLKKVCYIENKKIIEDYLKEVRERREIEAEDARLNDCFLTCPLCSEDELIASQAITCPDGHVFCMDCIKRYIEVKLGDAVYKFVCPIDKCDTIFTLSALENLLPEKTLEKIIKKQQAEEISVAGVDGLESCPFCEYAYIPNPADKIFKCQNPYCLIESCRKCHEKNHIPLRCEEVERPVDVEARKQIEEAMTRKLVRTCPNCGKNFVKLDGCNKMVCTCGTIICYLCRARINGYSHFRSSGGTCPLYSNNADLHEREVLRVGIQTRDEILRQNPDIHLFYNPSDDEQLKL